MSLRFRSPEGWATDESDAKRTARHVSGMPIAQQPGKAEVSKTCPRITGSERSFIMPPSCLSQNVLSWQREACRGGEQPPRPPRNAKLPCPPRNAKVPRRNGPHRAATERDAVDEASAVDVVRFGSDVAVTRPILQRSVLTMPQSIQCCIAGGGQGTPSDAAAKATWSPCGYGSHAA